MTAFIGQYFHQLDILDSPWKRNLKLVELPLGCPVHICGTFFLLEVEDTAHWKWWMLGIGSGIE